MLNSNRPSDLLQAAAAFLHRGRRSASGHTTHTHTRRIRLQQHRYTLASKEHRYLGRPGAAFTRFCLFFSDSVYTVQAVRILLQPLSIITGHPLLGVTGKYGVKELRGKLVKQVNYNEHCVQITCQWWRI